MKGKIEVVKLLLERGANFGAKNSEGHSAQDVAKEEGYEEISKILQEAAKGNSENDLFSADSLPQSGTAFSDANHQKKFSSHDADAEF